MNRASFVVGLTTLAFAIPLSTIAACSSDRPAGSSGAVGPNGSTSSGGTSSGNIGDGGSSGGEGGPDASGLCTAGDIHQGAAVFEIEISGDMPPPLGGKVTPGLYNLSEQYQWKARVDAGDEPGSTSKPSGKQASMTLRISDTEAKLISAEGTTSLGADSFVGGGYKINGLNFTLEGRCPSAATRTFTFTASEAGIVLYEGSLQRIFSLVPPAKK